MTSPSDDAAVTAVAKAIPTTREWARLAVTAARPHLWKQWGDELIAYDGTADPYTDEWAALKEIDRLRTELAGARKEAIEEIDRQLFGTTDGGFVGDDSELPVGELRRLLRALLADDNDTNNPSAEQLLRDIFMAPDDTDKEGTG